MNTLQLSPSREADSRAATQRFPSSLWNLKVHYRGHISPSLVPIHCQNNLVNITHLYPSNIHFNIILLTTCTSP
jgi:hypothetical protein